MLLQYLWQCHALQMLYQAGIHWRKPVHLGPRPGPWIPRSRIYDSWSNVDHVSFWMYWSLYYAKYCRTSCRYYRKHGWVTGNGSKRLDLKLSGSEPETKFELTVEFSGSYSHCRTFDLHWRSFQLYSWCAKSTITWFKRKGIKNSHAIYNDNIAFQW